MERWFNYATAVVGLFIAIGLPILRQSTNMTRLIASLESLTKSFETNTKENDCDHDKFEKDITEHGNKLIEHDVLIKLHDKEIEELKGAKNEWKKR